MMKRRSLLGERLELYSPIGLIPVDNFTGKAPLGRLRVILDVRDEQGQWRETHIKETRTSGEIIAYPGLGRRALATDPIRFYRVRIESEFYMPFYQPNLDTSIDGINFTVFPYNDDVPPENYPTDPAGFPNYLAQVLRKVILMPAPNYPFSAEVLVLRGKVINSLGEPIVGAKVSWRNTEITLSAGGDVRIPGASAHRPGEFSLPIRPTLKDHLTTEQEIDAVHRPSNTSVKLTKVMIPQAVKRSQTITIPIP
jgi:hypothetical protein